MAFHRTFVLLALLLAACSSRGLDVVIPDPDSLKHDMVAHWPCDEATGGMLRDHSGFNYNGSIIGATWLPDSGHAGFGGALHFDSGNSVIVGSFPDAKDSWSVSLWVRPYSSNSGDWATLISTEIAFVGGWEMNLHLPTDYTPLQYHFAYPRESDAGPYEYYSCPCVDVDQWTHLVAVVDGSANRLSFYKNRVLQNESPITHLILPGSNALYLGTWSDGGRYFVGDLDDIVIYGRALTRDEVASLFAHPAPSNTH
jgi:hypothetical protein